MGNPILIISIANSFITYESDIYQTFLKKSL